MQYGLTMVKGGGEVGSAVALTLWRAGWAVVVAELPRPTVLRRQLSLAEAAFTGHVIRDGVPVQRVATASEAQRLLLARTALPLLVGDARAAARALGPSASIDARMRRDMMAEDQRGEAPLVVGLGPGLRAGSNVDVVVETSPGPRLGAVLWHGAALAHISRQRPDGEALAEEYAYSPSSGLWHTSFDIGQTVAAGEPLGTLDGAPVCAPRTGSLRGLVHDAVTLKRGAKLAAVHPGDWQRKEAGIGWRAATIAAAVLTLLDDTCDAGYETEVVRLTPVARPPAASSSLPWALPIADRAAPATAALAVDTRR